MFPNVVAFKQNIHTQKATRTTQLLLCCTINLEELTTIWRENVTHIGLILWAKPLKIIVNITQGQSISIIGSVWYQKQKAAKRKSQKYKPRMQKERNKERRRKKKQAGFQKAYHQLKLMGVMDFSNNSIHIFTS